MWKLYLLNTPNTVFPEYNHFQKIFQDPHLKPKSRFINADRILFVSLTAMAWYSKECRLVRKGFNQQSTARYGEQNCNLLNPRVTSGLWKKSCWKTWICIKLYRHVLLQYELGRESSRWLSGDLHQVRLLEEKLYILPKENIVGLKVFYQESIICNCVSSVNYIFWMD